MRQNLVDYAKEHIMGAVYDESGTVAKRRLIALLAPLDYPLATILDAIHELVAEKELWVDEKDTIWLNDR